MSGMVYEYEPKVVINLCPSCILPMNCPYLLFRSLPERCAYPVEIIDVVQYSRSVDNKIILSIVDENSCASLENSNEITSIAATYIRSK